MKYSAAHNDVFNDILGTHIAELYRIAGVPNTALQQEFQTLYPTAGVPKTLPYSKGLKQAARGLSFYATQVTILMINIFLKF